MPRILPEIYVNTFVTTIGASRNHAKRLGLLSACARSSGVEGALACSQIFAHVLQVGFFLVFISAAGGCFENHSAQSDPTAHLSSINLNDTSSPVPSDEPIVLSAAKNELIDFTITVSGPAIGQHARLRLRPPNESNTHGTIDVSNFSVYQILSVPIDVDRAGYVRQTGLPTSTRMLPRALLPLPMTNGMVDLSTLRSSGNTGAGESQTPLIWVDMRIPAELPAGRYEGACDILPADDDHPIATLPLQVTVSDFVLPTQRHLMMVGQVGWEDLKRLYPESFETLRPFLLSRDDKKCADAVHQIDQLQQIAEANRCELFFDGLQPTVKWPTGQPPTVLWDDYDAMVRPWLSGSAFEDRTPLGYWPLPVPEHLFNYDPASRRDYWAAAAAHFDQFDWLLRSGVVLEGPSERADSLAALKISADAAEVLNVNPRLRVVVPLEEGQVQFASDQTPNLVQPESAPRLITSSPGLVSASPMTRWPIDVTHGPRWMRTDLRGLMPYVGAGSSERDVRVWAWLADIPLPPPRPGEQYGPVEFVQWAGALPQNSTIDEPGDPDELVWFYPGSWFGVDQPLATVQLKWLRRAQQDYEYLFLARERGDAVNPLLMARLLTKPVELGPDQKPDPVYGLMSGTADADVWAGAMSLLTQRILLHEPGTRVDKRKEMELDLATLRWLEPQERPLLLGRLTNWIIDTNQGATGAPAVALRLGIDIYNASDRTPDENGLQWTDGAAGWHWQPQPVAVPQLATYHVRRFFANANIEPTELRAGDRKPAVITFTDGYTKQQQSLKLLAPIAISSRLEGRLKIDGNLDDWSSDDSILDGPMVEMFDRPSLQAQQLHMATTTSQIFTGWADENFYLAFKVSGISGLDIHQTQNWVSYEFRRAWGEDLCQVLIQAIYADGSLGPVLHVALKPNGTSWVERKEDPRQFADPWQAFEGARLRYAATLEGPDWRGEMAIPWKAIGDEALGRPIALRFNFSQHKMLTGESSSWAGPVDFGRDDSFTGLLLLRETETPGMHGN
jgi:hypothetical protein